MINATPMAAGRPQARENRVSGRSVAGASQTPQAGSGRGAAAPLGNAVKSSCAITESPAETPRRKRWRLRDKAKKYANRTLVPAPARVVRFGGINEVTGEVIDDKIEERPDRPAEDRFLACGSRSNNPSGAVGIKFDGSKAGYAGLNSCGSAWACTVCASKIQQQRAADLTAVTAWARRNKKTVALMTFTIRHQRADSLTSVWDAVAAGWGAVTAGKDWVSEDPDKYAERVDRWDEALQRGRDRLGRMPRNGWKYLDAVWDDEARAKNNEEGPSEAGRYRPRRRVGDQERFALMGWARAAEATHSSANGWHVHLHVLMVLDGEKKAAAANAVELGNRMWDRYAVGIATVTDAEGSPFSAMKEHGLDVRVAEAATKRLAEYLAKDGLTDSPENVRNSLEMAGKKAAQETALGAGKKGRKSGRTPFQILDAINDDKPGADLAVWREWVIGSMGRRQLTTSAGWRALANLPEELTDEEAAAEEACGDLVLTLPAESWDVLKKGDRLRPLELMETAGVDAVIKELRATGLVVIDNRPGAAPAPEPAPAFGPQPDPSAADGPIGWGRFAA